MLFIIENSQDKHCIFFDPKILLKILELKTIQESKISKFDVEFSYTEFEKIREESNEHSISSN